MALSDYAAMVSTLVVIAAALGFGATLLRARLVPGVCGAPARLAEAVLGLAALLMITQALGVVGALRGIPTIAACVVAGSLMAIAGRGRRAPRVVDRSALRATLAAVAAGSIVLFSWTGRALVSLDRGMTDGDTVWYHMPFAARFAQDASIVDLHYTGPDFLSWFYPANGELFHALGIVAGGGLDVLAPLLSFAWLGLALLAAWCIGRPFGRGAACVVAVAILLASPLIVEREPGAVRTDVAGIAFLLAAVGLLLNRKRDVGRDRGVVAIAALAAGVAVGTKLTLLPPVLAITVGVVTLSARGRLASTAVWAGGLLATGGFWYVRNLVHAGNPLPWLKLGIGPVALVDPVPDLGTVARSSVLDYAFSPGVWRTHFAPGLEAALGPAWPLIVVIAAVGVIIGMFRGTRTQRLVAVTAAVAAVAYLANPLGAPGPHGSPTNFEGNVRYLAPALALGLVLAPTVLRRPLLRWLPFALALILVGNLVLLLPGARVVPSLLLTALGAAFVLCALIARSGRAVLGGAIASALVVTLVVAGWPASRDYVSDRYASHAGSRLRTSGMGVVFRWAQDVRDTRIATTSILQYGLYGRDLSNRVDYLGVLRASGSFTEPRSCREWRKAVDGGDFDYLVLAPRYQRDVPTAPAQWIRSPNVNPVLRAGPTTVFRITGVLGTAGCRHR